jgi:hypothetical protein
VGPTPIDATMKLKDLKRNNIVLLICLLGLLFISPMARSGESMVRNLLQTAVFFSGVFSLDFSTKSLKILLPLGLVTAATTWLHYFLPHDVTYLADFITSFFFLIAIVILMIRHIARSRNVTPTIILSAINGYLLLGLLSAVLLAIADANLFYDADHQPGIAFPGPGAPRFDSYIYFGFVTLTTLGYGDVTPVSHLSRSLALLIAVTGQFYMALLIAMLVGKFLANSEGR